MSIIVRNSRLKRVDKKSVETVPDAYWNQPSSNCVQPWTYPAVERGLTYCIPVRAVVYVFLGIYQNITSQCQVHPRWHRPWDIVCFSDEQAAKRTGRQKTSLHDRNGGHWQKTRTTKVSTKTTQIHFFLTREHEGTIWIFDFEAAFSFCFLLQVNRVNCKRDSTAFILFSFEFFNVFACRFFTFYFYQEKIWRRTWGIS